MHCNEPLRASQPVLRTAFALARAAPPSAVAELRVVGHRMNFTMSITTSIDQIDTLITGGAPLSKIKVQLISLKDQAEALEARLLTLEAEAKNPDKDVLITSLQREVDKLKKEKSEIGAYYAAREQAKPVKNSQYT